MELKSNGEYGCSNEDIKCHDTVNPDEYPTDESLNRSSSVCTRRLSRVEFPMNKHRATLMTAPSKIFKWFRANPFKNWPIGTGLHKNGHEQDPRLGEGGKCHEEYVLCFQRSLLQWWKVQECATNNDYYCKEAKEISEATDWKEYFDCEKTTDCLPSTNAKIQEESSGASGRIVVTTTIKGPASTVLNCLLLSLSLAPFYWTLIWTN